MEIGELGKTPIGGGSPAGEDARYEPEYEELQEEIAKLTSPTGGGATDWKKVQDLSAKILAEKAKDLQVATYLSLSLLDQKGLEGLAQGLPVIKDMVETYWDDMFPPKKRMRGRKNAVEFLYEQIEAFLGATEIESMPKDIAEAINESVDGIESILGEKMEDPPYSRSLREALNMIPVQSDEPEPEPEPEPAAEQKPAEAQAKPAAAPPPSAPAAPAPGEMTSDQDAKKVLESGLKIIRQVASYYNQNEDHNPLAYTLTRLSAWLTVEKLPPAEEGVTKIPGPPDQIKGILSDLHSAADWDGLLKAAEPKVTQFLFWLDLSFYSYEALGGLGGRHNKAREAVARQTADFIQRLPGIENFMFADETPFASPQTKQWLAEIAAQGDGGGGGASGGKEMEEVGEKVAEAKGMAKEKKLAEAAAMLQESVKSAGSGRMRMVWRVNMANLLIMNGRPVTARPHLLQLLEDIDVHNLSEWDPGLALEALKTALNGFKMLKDDESKAMADEVAAKIAALDPGEAIRLDMK